MFLHYIKWIQLGKISRKNDEILNQAIFDFVKQYVKTNEKGEYICRSCSELLDLKKYVYEGTYVAELDTFLTTNLAVSSKLESLPKYEKYTRIYAKKFTMIPPQVPHLKRKKKSVNANVGRVILQVNILDDLRCPQG